MIRSTSVRSLMRASRIHPPQVVASTTTASALQRTRSTAPGPFRYFSPSAKAPNAAVQTLSHNIGNSFDPALSSSFVNENNTGAVGWQPDEREEFRRHRYLLHLVPVCNRYLAARRQGILRGVPAMLHPPSWDHTMKPRHVYAPMSIDHTRQPIPGIDATTRLDGVIHWMEDLYLHGTTRVEAVLSPAHHTHGEGTVDLLAYPDSGADGALMWRVGADGVVELVPDAEVNEEDEGLYVPHINTAFWELGSSLLEAYKFCAVRRAVLRGWDAHFSELLASMHLSEDSQTTHTDGRTALPSLDRSSMPPAEFGNYLYLPTVDVSLPVWRSLTIDENPHHLREGSYPEPDSSKDEHELRLKKHERACEMYSVVLGWEDLFDAETPGSFARALERLPDSDAQEHAILMSRLKKSYIEAYSAAANYM
ncbi:hypothetical protein BJ742DRAFT_829498 [Cladochytrium replicatum]|nr:hypothetical protein BJ742DRAFT_829498 [Cladochytrium replicatum]